ncbi:MAG: hypothetical protein HY579_07695 [Nitrospinae bacterium]|nr:hypothetical protein [Nitrospinota bacterium]
MKTLVWVGDLNDLKALLLAESKEGRPPPEPLYVAGDPLVIEELLRNNLSCNGINAFFSRAEFMECEELALSLAREWSKDEDGSDFTRVNGIPLSQAIMRFVYYHFAYALRAVHGIANLLEKERPGQVRAAKQNDLSGGFYGIHGRDLRKEILKLLQPRYGYELIWTENAESVANVAPAPMGGLTRLIKTLVILGVDGCKTAFRKAFDRGAPVNILVPSASDIGYLRPAVVRNVLRAGENVNLSYLFNELNCYLHPRLTHRSLDKYKTPETGKTVRELAGAIAGMKEKTRNRLGDKRFVFRGLPFWPIVENFFNEFFDALAPQYIEFAVLAEEAVKDDVHLVVITTNTMPYHILLTLLGKRHQVPVLHIPHGFSDGIIKDGKLIQGGERNLLNFPFLYDLEVVGLKYNVNLRVKKGIDPKKLILAGIPQYEVQLDDKKSKRTAARKKLGLDPGEEVVAFATERSADRMMNSALLDGFETVRLYKSLISVMERRAGSRLVFKFRVGDELIALTRELAAKSGGKNVLVLAESLQDLLWASDVVMIINSSVGVEALYYDVPVVQIMTPSGMPAIQLEAEGAAIGLYDPQSLPAILDRLRNDPEYREARLTAQREFLDKNLISRTGGAKRMGKIVAEIALAGKNGKPAADFSRVAL